LTPFVANAVTGGDPNITSGQTAAIAGIATLTGGLAAGLAGQNAMAGATAAQNEALNNCLGHSESCLQMAKNALNSASDTASNVWTGITNPQPSPNSGFTSAFTSAMNAGATVPGMESATNLDLLKGVGNVGLNLSSFSLPGMPDYTPVFQYNNPLIGGIGETYGVLGMSSLVAGGLSGGTVTNRGATGTVWDSITATQPTYPGSVIPQSFEMSLPNGQSVWVHGNATEHMAEYAQMVANNNPPEVVRLTTQQQLSSLQSAVNTATQGGVPYNQLLNVGGWELKFAPPRQPGQLPALIHALPTGK
jgi:filamentous hemagglutinin